jgi:choline dehydrogenase-like flavoprotein
MLVDIGELREGEVIEADICIVGSGPSGMALANELLGGEQRVVMVESGGLEPAPETARLDRGESVGAPGVGMTEGRARVLGGASRLWAGQCLPLDFEDFTARPWVADSGWPISHADLQPFVARAERFFEVDGEPYDERVWAPFGLEPLPLDRSKLTHLATVYTPQPDLGIRFRETLERSRNVRVLLRATATRLEAGEGGRAVTALRAKGLDGREARIRAQTFALCAGAIENARLLLLSDGLGNDRDLVGRYFQDHPNVHVGSVETASPRALLDRYSLLYRKPLRYWAKMGAAPQLQEERQILNGIANLKFDFGADSGLEAAKRLYRAARRRERPADAGQDLVRVGRDLPDLARAYRRFRRGLSPASTPARTALQLHVEQAPDRESRVRLGTELDPLGQPVAQVDWRVGDQDVETACVIAEAVRDEFARLGIGRVHLTEWRDEAGPARGFSGAYHYMGTTRMSESPSRGVVDRDCAVHGVAGLYCCGGSVFPAGGVANPTLAMVALAIRLADHLRDETA